MIHNCNELCHLEVNKKAQLSLTNPRDAKACQTLLQFDVLTTLSLTILAYIHSFICCCVRNLRNPKKLSENSNLYSSRSSKVIDLGVNRKRICNFLLVTNSNATSCYTLLFAVTVVLMLFISSPISLKLFSATDANWTLDSSHRIIE